MADAQALFGLLRQTADPAVVEALKTSVETDQDRFLNRINPLAYAEAHGLDEEETIGGFVHAARLGLFDMSWNMLCPGCGGVLEAGAGSRRSITPTIIARCARPITNRRSIKLVEVTFTVNPAVRRIAAHDPDSLPFAEYMRQIFWSSGGDIPEDIEGAIQRLTLDFNGAGSRRKGGDVAEPPERICDRLRPRHPLVALSQRRRRGDQGAPQSVDCFRRRPCAQRHAKRSSPARCVFRSKTRPPGGRCRGSGSTARRWTR